MVLIQSQIEADTKNKVIHETFGHLFPEKIHYEGVVRIAYSIYNNVEVLDESEGLPEESPWWFHAITEYAYEESISMSAGEVAEFKIVVDIVTHTEELEEWETEVDPECEAKTWQTIEVSRKRKKILIKAF